MIDAEGEELGEHLTYVTLEPGETKTVAAARIEIRWLSATGGCRLHLRGLVTSPGFVAARRQDSPRRRGLAPHPGTHRPFEQRTFSLKA